jgi:hypothetical protein
MPAEAAASFAAGPAFQEVNRKLKDSPSEIQFVKQVATMRIAAFLACCVAMTGVTVEGAETKVPVTFSGGHETDPRDHGRPVVLIATALNVKPELFRKAFSGVTPARGRGPTGEEARRNKEALMKVLGPYKVTNERLDEVSNYYRYRPQKGELWPTRPAKAFALVEGAKIKKVVVAEPGAGFSSPPSVTVKGFEKVRFDVKLKFETDLKRNGGIASIDVMPADRAAGKQ